MNILKMFSIHDQKANAYITPFFLPNEGMAIRAFSDSINDPNHAFSRHPDDYTLFEIGTFGDTEGHLEPHTKPVSLGNGVQYVKAIQPPPTQIDLEEVFGEGNQR